ncbi:hypothetical protein [Mangrovicoccus sp. HB161399]|uniref:hypothetical protein n=1 Tax=Mangrovicoccus sp. HB161399 TaxID=2720392 RepID=UPI001557D5A2|nr:hypothetical protein [Mangrovicoccus sp. HB161399]
MSLRLLRSAALLLVVALAGAAEAQVRTNRTAGKDYHHLAVDLTADMLRPVPEGRDGELAYRLSDGGMFEIYLAPDALPGVAAPGCTRIVLRMPWTDPLYPGAQEYVAEKAALLDGILALRDGARGPVPAVLELDPYAVHGAEGWKLTDCLAFFRTARGRYVPQDGPLDAP